MKDNLDEKIMIKFIELRAKFYSYIIDNHSADKKGQRHKNVCHGKKT